MRFLLYALFPSLKGRGGWQEGERKICKKGDKAAWIKQNLGRGRGRVTRPGKMMRKFICCRDDVSYLMR
jgi:hypothetical protein